MTRATSNGAAEVTTTMTVLDDSKTVRFTGRSGRPEIWEATSADGRWRYVRLEMPSTPWEVTDMTRADEPGYQPEWLPSLPKARRWTAAQPQTTTA